MSKRFLALFLIVLVPLFYGCAEESGQSEYQIGSVLPLTGSAAVWGQNAQRGMNLALEEINSEGGINGEEIEIIYKDSQSEPKVATSALQNLLATQDVPVVIGDIASSSVLAMAPIAEKNEVVLLSPGASNPKISDAGEYIFRNWHSDAMEGEAGAEYAYDKLGWRDVAILNVNNAYGVGLADVFTETFESLEGEVAVRAPFPQGATDVRAQISKIDNANPDGIYMPGYPPEMATALIQMEELGVDLPVLSTQSFDDPEIIKRAGDAAEGVIFSIPKPPDTSRSVVSHFQEAYTAEYGEKPGVTSDTGYDAVRMIARAFENGATTAPEIKTYLDTLKGFPGAVGLTTFNEDGDMKRDFTFLEIKSGKQVRAQ
jgi:branched-chain amino acid transport system substrate-binding protein